MIKAVGRDAAVRKYDLLSALMAHAMAGDKMRQKLVLRLMSIITSRYNWQRNELTMGQKEMARLWCVDERTVKREIARLRALDWIEVKQPGTRGRVAVLGLNLERIMIDTQAEWPNIGPDFVARVGVSDKPVSNVFPLHPHAAVLPQAEGIWREACHHLAREDRVLYDSWFAALSEVDHTNGCLTLRAPSRFHATYVETHLGERMRTALHRSNGVIMRIRITSP